jgi:hypothetical protein
MLSVLGFLLTKLSYNVLGEVLVMISLFWLMANNQEFVIKYLFT